MAKLSTANLKPNPFTTYRDIQTGRWLVGPSPTETARSRSHQPLEGNKSAQLCAWDLKNIPNRKRAAN
ncbi:MAG: hypothetical protein SW833_21650 [Cyanobacteriota bacterium]|nr:hypothetical protein [Cyanobacteriota bacterium]